MEYAKKCSWDSKYTVIFDLLSGGAANVTKAFITRSQTFAGFSNFTLDKHRVSEAAPRT